MLDILIKSYNRPYYLDRCIYSIKKFVTDNNYRIIVLDDGTPQIYLDKILEKYTDISIQKSRAYTEKSIAANKGVAPRNKQIPINLWFSNAQKASDFFLLLEDDIWFTQNIKLETLVKSMRLNNGVFTKLFWLGNTNLIQHKKANSEGLLNYVIPNLPFKNPFLFWLFFKVNRLKIHKISKFLKIYSLKKKNSYYSIYSVAGVIFEKRYFLQLWNNHTNDVDEKLQILNTLKFIKKNKGICNFAHTQKEYLKTGFISSATNKIFVNEKCDMHHLNKELNQLWLTNKFDPYINLNKDFSIKVISDLLSQNHSLIDVKLWVNWTNSFKKHFEKMGCNLG